MLKRNETPEFGWNWIETAEGYAGFMDDYGLFIQEWRVMP